MISHTKSFLLVFISFLHTSHSFGALVSAQIPDIKIGFVFRNPASVRFEKNVRGGTFRITEADLKSEQGFLGLLVSDAKSGQVYYYLDLSNFLPNILGTDDFEITLRKDGVILDAAEETEPEWLTIGHGLSKEFKQEAPVERVPVSFEELLKQELAAHAKTKDALEQAHRRIVELETEIKKLKE